jgi:hypothetical protein
MSEITVQSLQLKVDEWHEKRNQVDAAEEVRKELSKELEAIGYDLTKMMEELNLEKFEGTLGKVRLHEDEYVSMPEDEFKRAEFINYLKETGEWDTFATIHHQKLQAWHKAKQEEHGAMFMAPGLELPKTRKSIRKGR